MGLITNGHLPPHRHTHGLFAFGSFIRPVLLGMTTTVDVLAQNAAERCLRDVNLIESILLYATTPCGAYHHTG